MYKRLFWGLLLCCLCGALFYAMQPIYYTFHDETRNRLRTLQTVACWLDSKQIAYASVEDIIREGMAIGAIGKDEQYLRFDSWGNEIHLVKSRAYKCDTISLYLVALCMDRREPRVTISENSLTLLIK